MNDAGARPTWGTLGEPATYRELRIWVPIGAVAAAVGLFAFVFAPWTGFGFVTFTGLDVAKERSYLRLLPAIYVLLGSACRFRRKRLLVPGVVGGLAVLLFGLSELSNAGPWARGWGIGLSIISLVGAGTAALRSVTIAHDGESQAATSATVVLAGTLVASLLLGFSEPTAEFLSRLFRSQRLQAIQLVQRQSYPGDFIQLRTWAEAAPDLIPRVDEPRWDARQVEPGVYIVSLVATKGENNGRGHFFEVNLSDSTVTHVNDDEFLSAKYGLTRARNDAPFEIDWDPQMLDKRYDGDIFVSVSGRIRNRSGKTITSATLSLKAVVVFGERKVVNLNAGTASGLFGLGDSGFERPPSSEHPWRDGAELEFQLRTSDVIERIYLEYTAQSARVELGIRASDPVGYNFEGVIASRSFDWEAVRRGDLSSRIDSAQAKSLTERHINSRIESCISKLTTSVTPLPSARLAVHIDRAGKISSAKADVTGGPPEFASCLEGVVRGLRLPPMMGELIFETSIQLSLKD